MCKKALNSTPTMIQRLLGPRKTTLAVVRLIATTRASKCPREREPEEEAEARDARQGMESKRL